MWSSDLNFKRSTIGSHIIVLQYWTSDWLRQNAHRQRSPPFGISDTITATTMQLILLVFTCFHVYTRIVLNFGLSPAKLQFYLCRDISFIPTTAPLPRLTLENFRYCLFSLACRRRRQNILTAFFCPGCHLFSVCRELPSWSFNVDQDGSDTMMKKWWGLSEQICHKTRSVACNCVVKRHWWRVEGVEVVKSYEPLSLHVPFFQF